MTIPLSILATMAVLVGFLGTPAWPWFQTYLNDGIARFTFADRFAGPQLKLMLLTTLVVGAAFAVGWRIYGKVAAQTLRQKDPLEKSLPAVFGLLQNKFYIDELYAATVIRLNRAFSIFADWLDRAVWSGAVNAVSALTVLFARFNRTMDESAVNKSFDLGCEGLRDTGGWLSCLQNGRVQRYLKVMGLAFSILLLALIWVIA
jgi:NADH-quinone oxidoreductase subunit L